MATVDPASQLAALIRAQLASSRTTRNTGKAATGETRTKRDATEGTQLAGGNDLSSVVAGRIRSISADDPQRRRKAFRMFLEVVVLSELGSQLANDPKFSVMLDHIEAQMERDADLANASQQAAEFLLQTADEAAR